MNSEWTKFVNPASWSYAEIRGEPLGALPVAQGGLGVSTGISGGIPYFSSTNSVSSSALLAQYGVMIGGGAGATPATISSNGSTTWALFGNASNAPAYAHVTTFLSSMAVQASSNVAITGGSLSSLTYVSTAALSTITLRATSTVAAVIAFQANTSTGLTTTVTAADLATKTMTFAGGILTGYA